MISNSRHSRWSALCGRALSLAAALALSSAAMAEKLTIVSTDFVLERKFLGHRLLPDGRLGIAPQSLERARGRLRRITRRSRGVSV